MNGHIQQFNPWLETILMAFTVFLLATAAHPINASASETIPSAPHPPHLVLETGGHLAVIRSLSFTANGRELISTGDDKTIRIWSVSPDGRTADLKRTIRGPTGPGRAGQIFASALSPPDENGMHRWLAVGGYLAGDANERNAVRLHDYASGDVKALLKGHGDHILALSFSPSGRWLASAGKDRTIRLWDLSTVEVAPSDSPPIRLPGHTDRITDLAWSSTGNRLASASYDGTVGLWDTTHIAYGALNLIARLKGHSGKVRSVVFHPHGPLLASGGDGQRIRIWQAKNGAPLGVLAKADHALSALAFSPDGKRIVAGNFNPPEPRHVSLFSYPQGKRQIRFGNHENLVIATTFHPGGEFLASAGGDHKEILLWHADSGEVLSRLAGRGRTVYAVAFSKAGRYISWGQTSAPVSTNDRGPLEQRFDLLDLERIYGGLRPLNAVRAQESIGTLALNLEKNNDSCLIVKQGWRRLCEIRRTPADGFWHSAYTLSPDGQSLLSGGQNGELRLFSINGASRGQLVGHTGKINAVAMSADGRWALSGANDQTVILWDLAPIFETGKNIISPALTLFPAANGEWIAWSPEGYFAASAWGSHLVGYSVNQGLRNNAEFVSIDQLYDRFYRPDLVLAKLLDDPHRLWQHPSATTDAKTVIADGLAPRVVFIDPTNDEQVGQQAVNIHASIMDQGGGIGKAVWKINGTTVGTDSAFKRPVTRLAEIDEPSVQPDVLTLEHTFELLPGDNRIELLAYNQRNEIASSPAVLRLTVQPPSIEPPTIVPTAPSAVLQPLPQPDVTPPAEPILTAAVGGTTPEASPATITTAPSPLPAPVGVIITTPNATQRPIPQVHDTVSTAMPPAPVRPPDEPGPIEPESGIAVHQPPTPESFRVTQLQAPSKRDKVSFTSVPQTPPAAMTSSATAFPRPPDKPPTVMPPALHLLVVGIDNYRDRSLRLKYAVQDGRSIAEIIRQTGVSLFRNVEVTMMFDDRVTVTALEQTFRDIKASITPQDVFMFYLAGHGVTRDGRYYFLPYDFRYTNDEAVVLSAVNQDHLQKWLSMIPARKSLVLIDTCESGSFTQSMVAMRGMAQKTAISKLTRATGRATIVASTDEQPAYEGYQGHGVFTYVLLEGLRHADMQFGNRDGYTGLFELAAYVNDQVPAITMNAFNFEQIPQVHMVGTDFPIGVASIEDS